jgi:tetratricopeptide (TPR) repeat protein
VKPGRSPPARSGGDPPGAGRRLRQDLGSTWDLPLFTSGLAHVQLYMRRWDDAVAEAKTAVDMAADGAARGALLWSFTLLAYVALHRGELEAADEVLDEADAFSPPDRKAMASDAVAWCRGLLHEARGDIARAALLMEQAWQTKLPFKGVVRVRMAADAVRVARASGADAFARSVTETTEEMARQAGSPLDGMARRCRDLLENDPEILLDAIAHLRRSSRPVEVAFACEDAAVALARHGRARQAIPPLEEALAAYEDVGADRDVARTERRCELWASVWDGRGPEPRRGRVGRA